ncbi:hypothetical protein ACP4OV_030456 [Aristida adscensionis]
MKKMHTIFLALNMVFLLCWNVVEAGAYMNHGMLSRKGLTQERKLVVTTGVSPSLNSLSDQATGNINAGHVNNNAESTNSDMAGTASAYTPTTATTTDSHHDLSVDQYRKIIHNNQDKP